MSDTWEYIGDQQHPWDEGSYEQDVVGYMFDQGKADGQKLPMPVILNPFYEIGFQSNLKETTNE